MPQPLKRPLLRLKKPELEKMIRKGGAEKAAAEFELAIRESKRL